MNWISFVYWQWGPSSVSWFCSISFWCVIFFVGTGKKRQRQTPRNLVSLVVLLVCDLTRLWRFSVDVCLFLTVCIQERKRFCILIWMQLRGSDDGLLEQSNPPWIQFGNSQRIPMSPGFDFWDYHWFTPIHRKRFEESNNPDAFIMLITFTYDWNCLYREFGLWDCLPKEENLVAVLSWNIYSWRAVYILGESC